MVDLLYGPSNNCAACGGEGEVEGLTCLPCLGTGKCSTVGLNMFLVQLQSNVMSKLDDLEKKIDIILKVKS